MSISNEFGPSGTLIPAQSALFSLNPFMGNMLLVAILSCSVPYLEAGTLSSGDVTALLLYGTFSGIALASFGNFWASMNKARVMDAFESLWNH